MGIEPTIVGITIQGFNLIKLPSPLFFCECCRSWTYTFNTLQVTRCISLWVTIPYLYIFSITDFRLIPRTPNGVSPVFIPCVSWRTSLHSKHPIFKYIIIYDILTRMSRAILIILDISQMCLHTHIEYVVVVFYIQDQAMTHHDILFWIFPSSSYS